MQVRLDDPEMTYYGDINVAIHPGQGFLEIPVLDEAPSYSWGAQMNIITRPSVSTILLQVQMMKRTAAVPDFLVKNHLMPSQILQAELSGYHISPDAEVSISKNIERMETCYHYQWRALVCPMGLAEQLFDLDIFTPA